MGYGIRYIDDDNHRPDRRLCSVMKYEQMELYLIGDSTWSTLLPPDRLMVQNLNSTSYGFLGFDILEEHEAIYMTIGK